MFLDNQHTLGNFSGKKITVAYSGGMDSHVLLHLVKKLESTLAFKAVQAIHVNHQIHASSHLWQKHCELTCEKLNIPLRVALVKTKLTGSNLEAKARKARFELFKHCIDLDKENCLLLAHHQMDQVETVLMRLLKGSGPTGLASMRTKTTVDGLILYRPLLHCSKHSMCEYAEKNKLESIEDESNDVYQFDRNFLRHEVIPTLQARFGNVEKTITRTATLCAMETDCLNQYAQDLFKQAYHASNQTLSCGCLLGFSEEKQNLIIRCWFAKSNANAPSYEQLTHIREEVLLAREDANPILKIGSFEVRRFSGYLYLIPPNNKQKLTEKLNNFNQNIATKKGYACILRDKIKNKKFVKHRFQESKIPPWERDYTPFVYQKNKYIGVGFDVICD